MSYQIIATLELSVEDEAALGSMVNTIKTFAANNNGKEKLLIRTEEE